MWCTPKVKATFGVLFMTKISKQIKLQAIQDYMSEKYAMSGIFSRLLIAAYRSFGSDILFNPPEITPEFVMLERDFNHDNADLATELKLFCQSIK